jgi:transposase
VVASYARKTVRLNEALQLIGFLMGGETGALATLKLAMKASPDTLLRRVRQAALPGTATPRVLGVDDFAFRRGRRYGTILVDLEQHRPLDLLPDREAETLGRWLKAHPGIEIVSRDRSQAYAGGITEGAPQAVQVADRFHLLKNIRDALERLLLRENRLLRSRTMAVKLRSKSTVEPDYHEQCRLRLLPHLQSSKRKAPLRRGSASTKRPSPRQAAWLLLSEKLREEEQQIVADLCQVAPEIKRAQELAQRFTSIVRERKGDQLREWLIKAARSELPEFVGLARGITEDLAAVQAALEYEWSNGQVEGQVNRLKMIKRQMYGRAKFDLLRARVLRAA